MSKTITFNGRRLQIYPQKSDTKQTRAINSLETKLPAYTIKGSKKLFTPTGEILLIFKAVPTETELNQIWEKHPITFVKQYSTTRIAAKIEEGTNPIDYVATLEAIEGIKSVEVDLGSDPDHYSLIPSDNLFSHQWHLQNNGLIPDFEDANHFMEAGADAKILEAWNELGDYGSSETIIAVSDNGFDLAHPDFAGASKIVHPLNLFQPDSPIFDGSRTNKTHGTPCAGIALASANGIGTVGICPNARLMPIDGTNNGWKTLRKIVDYCIDKNVAVLSMSWGENNNYHPLSQERTDDLNRLLTKGRKGKGTVVVIAAGNDYNYRLNYLATHPNVIAVGATTSQDFHASYSNIGELTVCAPGGGWPLIAPKASWANATWHPNANNTTRPQFDRYTHFTGTSGATPLVAGVCALILSANPDLTADEVKRILVHTTDKVGHPSEYSQIGHSVRYGYGRVNALKAVQMAKKSKLGEAIPLMPSIQNSSSVGVNDEQLVSDIQEKTEVSIEVNEPLPSTDVPQLATVVNIRENGSLNVRFEPKVVKNPSNISRTLKKGEQIKVRRKANEKWYELASEYVHAGFLQIGEKPSVFVNKIEPKDYFFELPEEGRPSIEETQIPEKWYPDIELYWSKSTNKRTSEKLEHITTLVIHATVGGNSEGAVSVMKRNTKIASFHWLVPAEKEYAHKKFVWACVGEKKRAWHVRNSAKHSQINGGKGKLNDVSLGIEIVNKQDEKDPFSKWQLEITAQIARYCWAKYPNLKYIVSHAALDPTWKKDPGTQFPWNDFQQLVVSGEIPTPRNIQILPSAEEIRKNVISAKDIQVDEKKQNYTCWDHEHDMEL